MKKPTKRLAALILLPLLLTAASAHSAEIADSGTNRYKALPLTPEVYSLAASPDLADLRLADAAGEPVPYFIRSAAISQESEAASLPLTPVHTAFEEQGSIQVFDFYAAQPDPLTDVLATSISFQADAASFAAQATLLGGFDGQHWQPITEQTLYQVDGHVSLEIPFSEPLRYSYYRLTVPHEAQSPAFSGAALHYSVQRQQAELLTQTLAPAFSVREEERRTVITLSGLRHLRLSAVTLDTDSMFQREISCPLGAKRLYQLSFEDVSYADLTLPLNGAARTEDTLELTIQNGDDKPLSLRGVTVRFYAGELIFAGGDGPYTLTFGEEMPAPQYDIASYREQVLAQPLDRLSVGAVSISVPATEPAPPAQRDWTLAYNLAILAAAILLAFVILRALAQKPRT